MLVVINELMELLQLDPLWVLLHPCGLQLMSRNQDSNPVFMAITSVIIFPSVYYYFFL